MIIGITDPMRDEPAYAGYVTLVKRWIPEAETQKLSCVTGTFAEIERCDAVVLSGGGDVHPKFYSRNDAVADAREVSVGRDLFEFDIIRETMERKLPVFGICRGSQIFNVAMGGTLIPDIEAAGLPPHRREGDGDGLHGLRIVRGSMLHGIVGLTEGSINSSHHQSAENVGKGLRASAHAEDGIIEALEWENPAGKPFVLLVQWHPERLRNVASPFAKNLMERLAAEVRSARTA